MIEETKNANEADTAGSVRVDAGVRHCKDCRFFGKRYHQGLSDWYHHCEKSSERRADYARQNPHLDFMDHFRLFFDAREKQTICKYFEERA